MTILRPLGNGNFYEVIEEDETRLSGTYGSDIDPLDDLQCEDFYTDEPDVTLEYGDIYYENDEPLLWEDEVTEDFPF